jgi:iron donor protein CyaY
MTEAEYRKKVQESMALFETALADVDPDIAECDIAHGALTIVFPDRTRCIMSAQPSVQQIWLALASLGTAHHFNYDEKSSRWFDDKGQGIELVSYMKKFLEAKTGLSLKL